MIVRHLRKSGGKAMYAGAGSIGITGLQEKLPWDETPRPAGTRTLACTKSSLGEKPISLGYEIRSREQVPFIEWLGPVSTVADDLMDEPGEMSALEQTCHFLRVELADGWTPSGLVQRRADNANISRTTLRRAREKLGVRVKRGSQLRPDELGEDGDPNRWYWALPVPDADIDQGVREAEQFRIGG